MDPFHNCVANTKACALIETAQDILAELNLPSEKMTVLVDALILANVMRIAHNRIANGQPNPRDVAYKALHYTKPIQ